MAVPDFEPKAQGADKGTPPEVKAETRPDEERVQPPEHDAKNGDSGSRFWVTLAVLGVVYGDLGTSPIYSLHAVFTGGSRTLIPSRVNVLGVLSLVFWTLIIVVSLKYMTFVLRADNRGEGGTFALLALLHPWRHIERPQRHAIVLLGLAGAAMLYAGVMITPAISILSAVEGLKLASPAMGHYVILATVVILILLFAVQRFGTAKIGVAFGPVMMVWFVVIAALGLRSILRTPEVVEAVNPYHAIQFFRHDGLAAFLVLFAVFLVTTGAEALYADIGHFGPKPIRWVWFLFVLPALLLNYFGQAALLLRNSTATSDPFYHLAPAALLYPVVGLATLATIIASQAAITGAFSMTRQAAQLGMMPRPRVVQTSEKTSGQIYVPIVNWVLMGAAIILVLLFQSSDRLASTYGISVSSAMVVTTLLTFFVAREHQHWSLWAALLFLIGFLSVDFAYFASNLLRIPHGGWFPVITGAIFFTIMSTWRRGRQLLTRRNDKEVRSIQDFLKDVADQNVARVPGTAVFLTLRLQDTPPLLSRHVERNRALQQQVVLLTVLTENVPRTTSSERIELEDLGDGLSRVILHYGYMQGINVPSELASCREKGFRINLGETTYYTERYLPISGQARRGGMSTWRNRLLSFLMRNSVDAIAYYQLPSDKLMEIGTRIRI